MIACVLAFSSACALVLHIARWSPAPFNVRAFGTGVQFLGDLNSPTPDATDDIARIAERNVAVGANPMIASPGLHPVTFRITANERVRVQPLGEPVPVVRLASRTFAVYVNPWAGLESVGVDFARWRVFDSRRNLVWSDLAARATREPMPVSSAVVESRLRREVGEAIASSVEPTFREEELPLRTCAGDRRCELGIRAAEQGDFGDAEQCVDQAVRAAQTTNAPWQSDALLDLGVITAASGRFAASARYLRRAADLGNSRAGALAMTVGQWQQERERSDAQGMTFEPQLSAERDNRLRIYCP